MDNLSLDTIRHYIHQLEQKGYSDIIIARKLSSTLEFIRWAYHNDFLKYSQFQQIKDEIANYEAKYGDNNLHKAQNNDDGISVDQYAIQDQNKVPAASLWHRFIEKLPHMGSRTPPSASPSILSPQYYLGMAFVVLIIGILSAGIYERFLTSTDRIFAYPPSPSAASRILSFQGRLTDSLGNPITAATNMRFRLYTASSGGTTLYDTGTCSITPDQDGVHNVLIGSDCGSEVASSVFTENTQVWLGVLVGSDAEMTPRQRIANVPYAINAETLQGLPVGTEVSTIPYINAGGDLLMAAASPQIGSTYTNQDFLISSARAITVQSAGSGDVTLTATESGTIKFATGGTQHGLITNGGLFGFGTAGPDAKLDVLYTGGEQLRLTYTDGSNYTAFTTDSGGDLTINPSGDDVTLGGDLILADTFTVQVGGKTATAYNAFANSGDAPEEAAIAADNDVYIGGDLEVDGTIYGSITASALPWSGLTAPTTDLSVAMAAYNTTFTWDPAANGTETAFTLNFDGEDSASDEEQILLALNQSSNGTDVTEAADALLTFTNSDANDPVENAIRFDAGAAGTDFTYGINFDAASIGTAEILLQNAETISNTVDGTIALGGSATISGNTTLGDASGDTVLANADAWTFANDTTVALSGGLNGLNFDTNTLSIDAANDRIGIGTAAPGAMLEVSPGSATAVTTAILRSGRNEGDVSTNQNVMVVTPRDTSSQLGLIDYLGRWLVNPGLLSSFGPATIDASLQVGSRTAAAKVMLIRGIAAQSGTLTEWQDSTGAVLASVDASGNLLTAGDLAVNGDDITSDGDLTINPAGGQVLFADADTFNIGGVTALAYNALSDSGTTSHSLASDDDLFIEGDLEVDGSLWADGTLTAGDLACTDCLDFDSFENTLDVDETTDINLAANNLTIDLDSTGIFDIRDGATTFVSFDDDSTIDVTFPAAGTLGIDAAATDNSTTAGVINLDVDTATSGNIGSSIDYQVVDAAGNVTGYGEKIDVTVDTDAAQSHTVNGSYIGLTANDASSTTYGLHIVGEDAGAQVATAGILIENLQATDIDLTTGLLIRATTDGSLPTAIDVSDAEITTALAFGANDIDGTSFDVTGSTGNITTGGDVAVNGGDITSTASTFNLSIANAGTINFTDGSNTLVAIKDQGVYSFLNLAGKTDTGDPGTCAEGDIYYNDTDDTIKICHESNSWEALDSAVVGSQWTDGGTTVYLTDTTDELVIGGSTPLSSSKVSIDGDADQIQLIVQGNATQTSNLATFEQSDGTDVFTITNAGNLSAAGDLAVNGDDITADGALTINSASYTRVGDTASPGSANGDDDLFVEGDLEIDGVLYTDGGIDTAFTAGSVVFAGASGVLAQDNASFFWDDTNNKLGLGDTSPDAKLEISGAVVGKALTILNETGDQDIIAASASGTTRFRVGNDGTVYGGYFADLSNTAYGIDPAGTSNFGGYSLKVTGGALLAADAGNVGIGDQTPDAKLNVLATTEQLRLDYDDSNYTSFTVGSSGDLTLAPSGGDTNITGNAALTGDLAVNGDDITADGALTLNSASYTRIGDTASPGSANGDDDLFVEGDLEIDGVLYTDGGIDTAFTAGSVVFAGASGVLAQDNASFFWDDSSNELGIGTVAPAATLDVLDTTEQLRLSYDASNYSAFTVGSSGDLTIAPSGGDLAITGNGDFSGGLNVASSNHFNIDTSGNVGIGTTASSTYGVDILKSISAASINSYAGIHQDITYTGTLGANRTEYGIYNNVTNGITPNGFSISYSGLYNEFDAGGSNFTGSPMGIDNQVNLSGATVTGTVIGTRNLVSVYASGATASYASQSFTVLGSSTSVANIYQYGTSTSTIGTGSTITNFFNYHAAAAQAATMTNVFGFYAADQAGTNTTNAYGAYIANQTGASGENVGVYIADADDYSLQLASTDGDAASGITFGTDTNLYRNGANVLHTDDSFDIDGNLVVDGSLDANGQVDLGDGGDTLTLNGTTVTLQNTGAGNDITINAVDQVILTDFTGGGTGCSALETDGSGNLTCGADAGGATAWDDIIDPDAAGSIAFAEYAQTMDWDLATDVAKTALSLTFTNDVAGSNTQYLLNLDNLDDAGANGLTESLLVLDNSDANEAVTDGILFVNAGGGFTDFIDTPSSVFKVDGSGNITGVSATLTGDIAVNGDDITADGALTINSASYVRIGDTASPGSASGDDDLFVESDLEVNGVVYLDGTLDTTFTAGSVFFAGTNGVLTQNNSGLFWDNSSNELGIGDTTPDAFLDVTGTTAQLRLSYETGDTNYTSFTTSSAGDLTIAPSGSDTAITGNIDISGTLKAGTGDAFQVDASGNVIANDMSMGAEFSGVDGYGDSGSLIANGSLELDINTGGLPDGWAHDTGSHDGTRSSSSSYNGDYHYRIDAETAENGFQTSCFPVSDAQTYYIDYYSKAASGTTSHMDLNYIEYTTRADCEADSASGIGVVTGGLTTTSSWAEFGGSYSPEPDIRWLKFEIENNDTSGATNQDLYIDAVRVWYNTTNGGGGLDLAETYPINKNENAQVAEIVSFGTNEKQNGADVQNIKKSSGAYDNNAFGVTATQPGLVLDDNGTYNKIKVALKGRVPVLVTTENGPIKVGDPITASSKPGVGMKATRSGRIVGYAMTEWTSSDPNEIDQVILFVNPETYVDLSVLTSLQESVAKLPALTASALTQADDIVINAADAVLLRTENLVAQSITAVNATIDSLIVDRIVSRDITSKTVKTETLEADKITTEQIEAKDATFSGKLVAQEIDADNIRELRDRLEKLSADNDSAPVIDSSQLQAEVESIQQYLQDLPDQDASQNLPINEITTDSGIDPGTTTSIAGDQISMMNVENLMVTGESAMTSLVVADSFTAGNIFIKDNSVLSLSNELKLSALEQISLMDGAVIIAKNGTITAKGEIIAEKGVRTNTIRPLDTNSNIGVQLSQNKVEVLNNDAIVAAIDNNGSAKFRDVSVDTYTDATSSAAIIAANDNYEENGVFSPGIQTNAAAAGNGILPANNDTVVIFNDKIGPNTLVYVTATSKTYSQNLYVAEKKVCTELEKLEENCKPYFTVHIDGAVKDPITFNWWTVN